MKGNYHTSDVLRQFQGGTVQERESLTTGLMDRSRRQPLRIRLPVAPGGPLLVGEREMLRKLRAAEMQAWEAVRPRTTTTASVAGPKSQSLWRAGFGAPRGGEGASFLLLSFCAAAVLFVSLLNLSVVPSSWAQFLEAIGNLFR